MQLSSPEYLLRLLKHLINHQNEVRQIHSILLTKGHLLFDPNSPPLSIWKPTLLYNTLIRAHLNFGQNHKTLHLFTRMLAHNAPPNAHTFPSLIKAATFSLPPSGTSLHGQIVRRGVLCDSFIQTSLLSMYSQLGDLLNARKVFDEISRPRVVEYNAMLDAFSRNGDLGSAVLFINRMSNRDVVSWTSVISGFSRSGLFREAIQFFREMIVHADVTTGLVKPNEATYVSVLSSCANLNEGGAFGLGKQIHGYIIRNEEALTVSTGTALVDLYGKKGYLKDAMKLFDQMVVRGVCTWNAMIFSFADNGREIQALDMFEKMRREGFLPNGITLLAVLSACARAKLVQIGLELFQAMWSEFQVLPIMEHYGCVVDLLGKAGLLGEAVEFIKSMPFDPDASVWGALLGACKIQGAIELGNEVGFKLFNFQPQTCGQYVTLSHINAGLQRWGPAADVRKALKMSGIRKVPASSWIDPM
ncbi:hypothetical protein K2173_018404 [Erythroxylum novogranatense]|uniref:Pentatricopeptide repeat-containing protein n=1 Tax=Erythroxylum novogranatense TaxID=1862640 RepID=A0AAV8UAC1_9ROSI|nr:hypothetical protein K2173_018404 [Erythroxylum novogranatense]